MIIHRAVSFWSTHILILFNGLLQCDQLTFNVQHCLNCWIAKITHALKNWKDYLDVDDDVTFSVDSLSTENVT